MSAARTSQVDLAKTFSAVTRTLKANQASLNEADVYNHNHGDNMVKNFQTITKAVRAKKDSLPADQLAYASEVLAQRQSGSAQLYAQGLAEASTRFEGQRAITPENAMTLVQALMGSQAPANQPAAQSADPMAGLLGALMGGQGQPGAQSQSTPGDMGSLLGGLLGGGSAPSSGQASSAQGGLDINTLLTAGMAFFQARQQGAAPMEALVQAVMSGSQMNNTTHHSQSGQLVASTLINVLGSVLGGKKR